ncbi:hypothetical protein NKI36_30730, partial [Mesorhizobium caraganae]
DAKFPEDINRLNDGAQCHRTTKLGTCRCTSGEAFSGLGKERTAWHRDSNRNPALCYHLENTAGVLTEKQASFDMNHVKAGIAESGTTEMVHGKGGGGLNDRVERVTKPTPHSVTWKQIIVDIGRSKEVRRLRRWCVLHKRFRTHGLS